MTIRDVTQRLLRDHKSDIANDLHNAKGALDRLKQLTFFREFTLDQWITDSDLAAPHADEANLCNYYLPGLTAQRVHAKTEFPWIKHLEDSAQDIAKEFDQILSGKDKLRQSGALHPHPESLVEKGAWDVFYFYKNTHAYEENLKRCPTVARALDKVPHFFNMPCGMAYFSIFAPGTIIRSHKGPTNLRLRCHLGLKVPDQVYMKIDEQKVHWTKHQCMVLDDSFSHEVIHQGTDLRAVLCFDFWHPDLTQMEIHALSRYIGQNR